MEAFLQQEDGKIRLQPKWGWQGQGLDAGAGHQAVGTEAGDRGPGGQGRGRGEVRESEESSLVQEGRARGGGAGRVPAVTGGTVLPAGRGGLCLPETL